MVRAILAVLLIMTAAFAGCAGSATDHARDEDLDGPANGAQENASSAGPSQKPGSPPPAPTLPGITTDTLFLLDSEQLMTTENPLLDQPINTPFKFNWHPPAAWWPWSGASWNYEFTTWNKITGAEATVWIHTPLPAAQIEATPWGPYVDCAMVLIISYHSPDGVNSRHESCVTYAEALFLEPGEYAVRVAFPDLMLEVEPEGRLRLGVYFAASTAEPETLEVWSGTATFDSRLRLLGAAEPV